MRNAGKKESEAGKTQFDIHSTLILLKPDTVARGIVGDIISRLERKSLKVVGMKLISMSKELLVEHYGHHSEKPYFPKIVAYMTDGPVLAMVIEGIDAVRQVRNLCGATDPQFAAPGTIRGDHSCTIDYNLIHASDSIDSADVEISRFFKAEEVFQYTKNVYVN
jgi:nucleoside-diphosphate kinase